MEFLYYLCTQIINNATMEKKAAIYLRVSTADQNYDRQEIELRELAQREGYTITQVFEEKRSAVLNYVDYREELEKMLQLTKNDVSKIYVWDITRLARNAKQFLDIVEKFTAKGICVHFKDKDIKTLDENGKPNALTQMYLFILGTFAQIDAENLKAKMNSAKKANLIKGATSYSYKPPFGYKRINKQLVIDEDEAQTVRMIFTLYSTGTPIQQICDLLNAQGKKTQTGNLWIKGTMHKVLTNPVYIGKPFVNEFAKDENGKRKKTGKVLQLSAPAIIEESVFNLCKKQLQANISYVDKTRVRKVMLRGLVKCAVCGKLYSTGGSTEQQISYQCTDKRHGITTRLGCKNGGMNVDYFDAIVWDSIKGIWQQKNYQEAEIKQRSAIKAEIESNLATIAGYTNTLEEIAKKIKKVNLGYINDVYSESEAIELRKGFENEKARIEKQKISLEARNKVLEGQLNKKGVKPPKADKNISFDEKKIICKDLIDVIYIYRVPRTYFIVAKVVMKVGIDVTICIQYWNKEYFAVDSAVLEFNVTSVNMFEQPVIKGVPLFTVLDSNNSYFEEGIFGNYNMREIWDIAKRNGLIKKMEGITPAQYFGNKKEKK